jgi:hypothetical protein
MPPEDARYEDPCIEDSRLHLRRTLRKARLTMAEASAEECEPAAGCARSSASSALVSGLTGRMSNPLSPRSNTFRGPPCSNPTRRHHSNGNTVWRFRVKVIVVVFMGNILLPHGGDATSFSRWMRVGRNRSPGGREPPPPRRHRWRPDGKSLSQGFERHVPACPGWERPGPGCTVSCRPTARRHR